MSRGILVGLLTSLLAAFGCDRCTESLAPLAESPDLPERANDPRKLRTEAELTKHGIPINSHLPPVVSDDDVRIRRPENIAKRAVVLFAITAVGHGSNRGPVSKFLRTEGLWDSVTPNERPLFESDNPSKQAAINASWRAESLLVLLWAMKKVDRLDLPRKQCDPASVNKVMPNRGEVAEFISSASLRSKSEILDETDKIYRIHWAVRNAQLNNEPIPARLNPSVVVERHHALNWLTWYAAEWDDVSTDT